MQQHHVLPHHLEKNLVIGILLCGIQQLDTLRVRFASMVQPSHLTLIRLQDATLDELFQYRR